MQYILKKSISAVFKCGTSDDKFNNRITQKQLNHLGFASFASFFSIFTKFSKFIKAFFNSQNDLFFNFFRRNLTMCNNSIVAEYIFCLLSETNLSMKLKFG